MVAVETIKRIFFGTQEKKIIAKNTIWISTAETIIRLSKFALIIYATRILGPTNFGQFSFALAFVGIFAVFADLGLSQIASRELSQKKESEKDFPSILRLKFVVSAIILFTIIITSKVSVTNDTEGLLILILSVFMISDSINELYYAFFQAKQKMQYEAWSKIIQAVLILPLGFILLNQFKSPASLGLSYALAGVASLIYIIILYTLKRTKNFPVENPISLWRKYLKISWPLALISIFAMVYNNIDSVMMGYYGQTREVGLYSANYRAINAFIFLAVLMNKALAPVVNENYIKSPLKFDKIFKYYLKLSILLIVLFVLFGIIAANSIIGLIFGPEYKEAVFSFRILIVMASLAIFSYPFTQALIAANKQKKLFWATFYGALINMVLNLILIPAYSLNGAAISTTIAVFAVVSLEYYFYRRKND